MISNITINSPFKKTSIYCLKLLKKYFKKSNEIIGNYLISHKDFKIIFIVSLY